MRNDSVNKRAASSSDCASSQRWAPLASSAAQIRSLCLRWATRVCSLEQTVPKSNDLPSTMDATAASISAESSTSTATFPAPTPSAGLPLE